MQRQRKEGKDGGETVKDGKRKKGLDWGLDSDWDHIHSWKIYPSNKIELALSWLSTYLSFDISTT